MNHLSLPFLAGKQRGHKNIFLGGTLISSLTHVSSLDIMNGPEPIAEEVYMYMNEGHNYEER